MKLSLVLPVFNTGYCLDELHCKLIEALDHISLANAYRFTLDYEFIYVEDCGSDQAWTRLSQMAAVDARVKPFRHLQNYGQHAAIATGLSKATGDLAVVMDADGRDPPAFIAELLDSYFVGNEIIIGVRRRISGSPLRQVCSFVVRRFFPLYQRLPNGKSYGSFWLIGREARMKYLMDPDRFRFSLKVLERIPVAIGLVDYDQVNKGGEKSSYSLAKLIGLFIRLLPEKILRRWFLCSTGGAVISSLFLVICSFQAVETVIFYSLLTLFSLCSGIALATFIAGFLKNDSVQSIDVKVVGDFEDDSLFCIARSDSFEEISV